MTVCRVAVVTPTLDTMGGTEQIVGQEARALVSQARVTFFAPVDKTVRVENAEVVPVRFLDFPGVFGTEAWIRAATRAIVRYRSRFDVIYSPGINCACATHINVYANFSEWAHLYRSLPLNSSLIEAQRRLRFSRLAQWERKIYQNDSTKLATISHLAAAQLAHCFGRTDVDIFPSTPEHDRFKPEVRRNRRHDARRALELDERVFVVATLGNAWHSKGFDILFDAWRGLNVPVPKRMLLVTTERPSHLKKMLGPLPQGVQLHPRVRQVEDIYSAADLVVLASRGETFGLPIAEAGAMGVPVRVAEHAGISGYVPEECVVRPNSPEAWQEAMKSVITNASAQLGLSHETRRRLAANEPQRRTKSFVEWILK